MIVLIAWLRFCFDVHLMIVSSGALALLINVVLCLKWWVKCRSDFRLLNSNLKSRKPTPADSLICLLWGTRGWGLNWNPVVHVINFHWNSRYVKHSSLFMIQPQSFLIITIFIDSFCSWQFNLFSHLKPQNLFYCKLYAPEIMKFLSRFSKKTQNLMVPPRSILTTISKS